MLDIRRNLNFYGWKDKIYYHFENCVFDCYLEILIYFKNSETSEEKGYSIIVNVEFRCMLIISRIFASEKLYLEEISQVSILFSIVPEQI